MESREMDSRCAERDGSRRCECNDLKPFATLDHVSGHYSGAAQGEVVCSRGIRRLAGCAIAVGTEIQLTFTVSRMESGTPRNGLHIKEGDTADVFAVVENDGWSWFPGCVLQSCDATIRFDESTSILNRAPGRRSEEHTSELQSHLNLVCRLLLEKKNRYATTAQSP